MKKVLCFILILLMLIPPMAVSAEDPYALEMSGAEGAVGETVTVTLSGVNLPACASAEFYIDYDHAVLKPTAFAKGSLTGLFAGNLEYTLKTNDGLGRVGDKVVKVAGSTSSKTTPLLSGSTPLVTVTFEIIGVPTGDSTKVELIKYKLSRMDETLTKITDIPLCSAEVVVEKPDIPATLEKIEVSTLPKTTYIEGQELDLSGGKLLATYSDSTTQQIDLTAQEVSVSGYHKNTLGAQTLTISYADKTTTFEVNVRAKELVEIAVQTAPKTAYIEGQNLDLSQGVLLLTFDNNTTETLPMTASGVSVLGYNKNSISAQTLTVSYADKSTTFEVTVRAKAVESISVKTHPNKMTYVVGEALDLSGGSITAFYDNGTHTDFNLNANNVTVSGYQPDLAGAQTLTVSCGGKQTVFSITVLSLQEAPTVYFSGGSGTVGSTVTLDLNVLRALRSGGFQLEFSYDPSMLEPIAWSDGLADNAAPNEDALGTEPGVLKLAGLYMEPFEGSQTLGTITFRLLRTGETEIKLEEGFFTSEIFGSAPVVSITAIGETKQLYVNPKRVQKVQLSLSGYAMGKDAEDLRLSTVEGVCPHTLYNEHYALLDANGTVYGAIKGGVNYTLGVILTPTENYTLTDLSMDDITLGGIKPSHFESDSDGILVYFNLNMLLIKNPFKDVQSTDWYYKAVLWAVSRSITNGTTATTFSPAVKCDRGQVVMFLWNAAGRPEPQSTINPFKDVKSSDYYYKAVLWAVEQGITNGTAPGKFSPAMTCDRAQIVTFLWNAAGKPQPKSNANPFKDVQSTDWYYTAILWAVEKGVTSGTAPGKFSPTMTCDRAQIVTFLYNLYKDEAFQPGGGII